MDKIEPAIEHVANKPSFPYLLSGTLEKLLLHMSMGPMRFKRLIRKIQISIKRGVNNIIGVLIQVVPATTTVHLFRDQVDPLNPPPLTKADVVEIETGKPILLSWETLNISMYMAIRIGLISALGTAPNKASTLPGNAWNTTKLMRTKQINIARFTHLKSSSGYWPVPLPRQTARRGEQTTR